MMTIAATVNGRSKTMSVSKWAYKPERCDGQPCCGDCDVCLSRSSEQDELVPARHGKWLIEHDDEWAGGGCVRCSRCAYAYSFGGYIDAEEFRYCPNCGAKMERDEEA